MLSSKSGDSTKMGPSTLLLKFWCFPRRYIFPFVTGLSVIGLVCGPSQALGFSCYHSSIVPESSMAHRRGGVTLNSIFSQQKNVLSSLMSSLTWSYFHHKSNRLFSMKLDEKKNSVVANGEMILANDKSLLNIAFSALNDKDKYETVLAGLCAKIIDGSTTGGVSFVKKELVDPIRLVEEMNSSGIVAGQRGVMSLVDAAALTSDVSIMTRVLSLFTKNGSLCKYGDLQASINQIPRTSPPYTFGSNKKETERLENLPPVPDDDRAAEVASAALFSVVVATSLALNVFGGLLGFEDFTPVTNLILGITVTTFIVDNFFDLIVTGGSTIATMNKDKIPEVAKNISAPKKEDMPLGLGSGSITGTVSRGLSRLLSVNTERDCECEAAAIFAAYSLGLPCFAFRPNALEGAALVVGSMRQENKDESEGFNIEGKLDDLSSASGLLKVLIWLMAPVAIELSKYPQLISSDPRESSGFLKRLYEKSKAMQFATNSLEDALPIGEEQTDDYLRWALAEADLLLRSNKKTVDELTEALVGGAATVGDCVAVLENW